MKQVIGVRFKECYTSFQWYAHTAAVPHACNLLGWPTYVQSTVIGIHRNDGIRLLLLLLISYLALCHRMPYRLYLFSYLKHRAEHAKKVSWHSCRSFQAQQSNPRSRQTIVKWLAITSVDLLLNAPDYVLRLTLMFADEGQPVWQWYAPVRYVSQLCYFGQFGINAISLSLVVYKRSIEPQR